MDSGTLTVIVPIVVGVTIGLLLVSGRLLKRRSSSPAAQHMAELDTYQPWRFEFEQLIRSGRSDTAIALYRRQTGSSMAKARKAVRHFQAESRMNSAGDSDRELAENASCAYEEDSQLRDQLVTLLRQGRKMEAIKVYRAYMNCGLKEAKNALDRLQAELPDVEGAATFLTISYEIEGQLRDQLVTLLRQGRKIKAIRMYRAQTGCGLKEAKNALDRLQAELPGVEGEAASRIIPYEIDDQQRDQLVALLRQGQKIRAIKMYREYTRSDLLNAKNAIDALQAELENQL